MTIPVLWHPSAGRFRILWDNRADAATTIPTASSEAADYPIENIQNIWPEYKHRTDGLAVPDWWKFDLVTAQDVDYVLLWKHNISAGGTNLIQGNAADAWGAPTVNDTPTWAADRLVHQLAATAHLRRWRIASTDAANPDGYLEAGRVFIGTYFEFRYSYARKTPILYDPSEIQYTQGGQLISTRRTQFRGMRYEFSAVDAAEFATLAEIYEAVGMNTPYWIIEDSDRPLTTSYYVQNISEWRFPEIIHGYNEFMLEVETVR